jgi:cyclopropane fatty-acyl-phospholipid synthase-like methyltransferase
VPGTQHSVDRSNGYEAVAAQLIRGRDQSAIGVATVRSWATLLPAGASILDLGCGHGVPISAALIKDGYIVYGVDASPSLAAEFQRRFPLAQVACEAAEDSSFFRRTFDGIVAIGLMFLLAAETQAKLIRRVASVLNEGGRFLFTAPTQCATWRDILTGRESVSLGTQEYERLLSEAGILVEDQYVDEGENHYYACVRQ